MCTVLLFHSKFNEFQKNLPFLVLVHFAHVNIGSFCSQLCKNYFLGVGVGWSHPVGECVGNQVSTAAPHKKLNIIVSARCMSTRKAWHDTIVAPYWVMFYFYWWHLCFPFLIGIQGRLHLVRLYNQQNGIFNNQCIRILEIGNHQKQLKNTISINMIY